MYVSNFGVDDEKWVPVHRTLGFRGSRGPQLRITSLFAVDRFESISPDRQVMVIVS